MKLGKPTSTVQASAYIKASLQRETLETYWMCGKFLSDLRFIKQELKGIWEIKSGGFLFGGGSITALCFTSLSRYWWGQRCYCVGEENGSWARWRATTDLAKPYLRAKETDLKMPCTGLGLFFFWFTAVVLRLRDWSSSCTKPPMHWSSIFKVWAKSNFLLDLYATRFGIFEIKSFQTLKLKCGYCIKKIKTPKTLF